MGSGTTAIAAIQEGRNYIGIELQPHYVEFARRVCEKEKSKIEFLGISHQSTKGQKKTSGQLSFLQKV